MSLSPSSTQKTPISATLDPRLHSDSEMPDKKCLSATSIAHADSDLLDQSDGCSGTISSLRPLSDQALKRAVQKADEDLDVAHQERTTD
jgi:hypothetical protein